MYNYCMSIEVKTHMFKTHKILINKKVRGWGNGSAVKSTFCSSKGARFRSQNLPEDQKKERKKERYSHYPPQKIKTLNYRDIIRYS